MINAQMRKSIWLAAYSPAAAPALTAFGVTLLMAMC